MYFQGSDIETLGSEALAELVQRPAEEEAQLQDTPASAGKNVFQQQFTLCVFQIKCMFHLNI